MLSKQTDIQSLTDEALMQRICAGSEAAFAELYDRYGSRMHCFFVRMLGGDAERARDFTQEVFLKIIEKPALFDRSRRFSTWIYSVAGNLCKNEYRRLASLRNHALVENEAAADLFHPGETDHDRILFEKQLRAAIATLDEWHRPSFVLRYQEGLSVREIAEIEDCPEGTIKSRLHFSVKKVSAQMSEWANYYFENQRLV